VNSEAWTTFDPYFPGTETGFDVEDTSIDGRDDIEGLDASAAHIANLLSSEPSDGTNSNSLLSAKSHDTNFAVDRIS
jgi:hypothetical protein